MIHLHRKRGCRNKQIRIICCKNWQVQKNLWKRAQEQVGISFRSLRGEGYTWILCFSWACIRSRSPSNRSPAATKETETQVTENSAISPLTWSLKEISPAEVAKYESENETSLELPRHPRHDELANRLAELERLKQQCRRLLQSYVLKLMLLQCSKQVLMSRMWMHWLENCMIVRGVRYFKVRWSSLAVLLSGREISEGELEDLKVGCSLWTSS